MSRVFLSCLLCCVVSVAPVGAGKIMVEEVGTKVLSGSKRELTPNFSPSGKCADGWDRLLDHKQLEKDQPLPDGSFFLVHARNHYAAQQGGITQNSFPFVLQEAAALSQKPLISTSLLSSGHDASFLERSGFVLQCKPGHILAMRTRDLSIASRQGDDGIIKAMDVQHAQEVIAQNAPQYSPSELLSKGSEYVNNEVVLRPHDDEGTPLKIAGVFIQKADAWGDEAHANFADALRRWATGQKLHIFSVESEYQKRQLAKQAEAARKQEESLRKTDFGKTLQKVFDTNKPEELRQKIEGFMSSRKKCRTIQDVFGSQLFFLCLLKRLSPDFEPDDQQKRLELTRTFTGHMARWEKMICDYLDSETVEGPFEQVHA